MKRHIALTGAAVVLCAGVAHAEDSVVLMGNYYLERSTRVISPSVTIFKDLPLDSELRFTYLVDQITSASGAFTVTDEPFSEYRQDLKATVNVKLPNGLTPGIGGRYSHEGDYRSHTIQAQLGYDLPNETTSFLFRFAHLYDIVRQRGRQGFRDTLHTTYLALEATQVLSPQSLGGATIETQVLRGYMENPYRVEQHPRQRNRYCLSFWAAYRFESTKTTLRGSYRFYSDTWDLSGHSFALSGSQRVSSSLEIEPEIRYHTQSDVFFTELVDNLLTTDPKLRALETAAVGARLSWTLSALADTGLDFLQTAKIQPSYFFLHQTTRYGNAHIAQLGFYWPFGR